ncbi:MAG: heme exporter protein CcmB [Sphingomonadaceae bacterium]|nr:heme exporter protein CcmB [Sphingomonadaceae bacterium]
MRALLIRDLSRSVARPGAALLALIFYLLVAAFTPFALGPDRALLTRVAPGILWIAALLAALMPVPTLFAEDMADGTLDQLAMRAVPAESVAAARFVAHWLSLGLPLLAATPIAAAIMALPGESLPRVIASLALGAPGLAGLGIIAGALTGQARSGAALAALVALPLATPILIFGAGMAGGNGAGAAKLLAASSLFVAALAPFAAGAAIKAARE